MALIFLIAALICLALGLLLASALWLVFSLVGSALAAILLFWSRAVARPRPAHARDVPGGTVDARPPGPVWVIDGRPRYHRRDCDILAGQAGEPIPRRQAVEDGFLACSLCEPDVDRAAHPAG